ncbi:MAG: hypothetical protein GX361_07965 [Bacteroidales bacterium]|nr:hypothetical protein [Bacteroidales bacterium]
MKRILLTTITLFSLSFNLFCQSTIHAHNGWYLPTKGNFRIFAVFAEIEGDTLELNVNRWEKGKMPEPSLIKDYQDFIHRYFSEASFGALNVTMHYWDKLIKIPLKEQDRNNGFKKVFEYLANTYNRGHLIQTTDGLIFPNDFDQWSLNAPKGSVKPNIPDNEIDFVAIFWRVNSSIGPKRSGGQGNWGKFNKKIGEKEFAHRIFMYSSDITVFQHEFAHGIVGSNNFHSAPRNGGTPLFIEDYPGYSILSGNARYHPGYNGWDRYRLGWQHPSQKHKISARDEKGNEKNGNLTYGQNIGDSAVFVLRDFASTNDAVRIKLPYVRTLNPKAREQWIWIENHQLLPDKVEYVPSKHGVGSPMSKVPRGIYLNIQVGNEDFSDFSSRTNYISPISRFGKFDCTYQSEWPVGDGRYGDLAITDDSFANPFTGAGFNAHPADNNSNDRIELNEYKNIVGIKYNNQVLGKENFGYFTYHSFGSVYDAFYEGDKISLSTNPTITPWLTHKNSSSFSSKPAVDDNRHIYLNGLCIRILEQRANGDVKISIRWNDFDIKNNVRWCGDIVLNEQVIVHPNCTVLLDQGLTPTKRNNPIFVNGQKVFANPTLFTAKNNSFFKIERKGTTILKHNSSYIAESGSTLELNNKSVFVVDSGSTLQIKAGARVIIKGRGKIVVKSGGYLCVEEGAFIDLQNSNSAIILEKGAVLGANPTLFNNPACSSSIAKTGKGSVKY